MYVVITIDLVFNPKTCKLDIILVRIQKNYIVQCTMRHSVVSISIDIDRLVCGSPFDNWAMSQLSKRINGKFLAFSIYRRLPRSHEE